MIFTMHIIVNFKTYFQGLQSKIIVILISSTGIIWSLEISKS